MFSAQELELHERKVIEETNHQVGYPVTQLFIYLEVQMWHKVRMLDCRSKSQGSVLHLGYDSYQNLYHQPRLSVIQLYNGRICGQKHHIPFHFVNHVAQINLLRLHKSEHKKVGHGISLTDVRVLSTNFLQYINQNTLQNKFSTEK